MENNYFICTNKNCKEGRWGGSFIEIPAENEEHIHCPDCGQKYFIADDKSFLTRFEGKPRGVFTYSLINTLQSARTPMSYQSLRERTQTKVYNLAEAQTPQLEVLDTEDVHKLFLDGTIAQASPYHIATWMNDRD